MQRGALEEEEIIKFDFEDAILQPQVTAQTTLTPRPQNFRLDQGDAVGYKNSEDFSHRDNTTKSCHQDRLFTHQSRSTMCRHWIRGMCWKGESCEFMHRYDSDKFPICLEFQRTGRCENKDKGYCMFSHEIPRSNQETALCLHYFLGFCRSGPRCKKRHERLDSSQLPSLLPDWYLHLIVSNAKSLIPDIIDPATEALMSQVETVCRRISGSNMLNEKGATRADFLPQQDSLGLSINSFSNTHEKMSDSLVTRAKYWHTYHEPTPLLSDGLHLLSHQSIPNRRDNDLLINDEIIQLAAEKGIPRLPGSSSIEDQHGVTRIFVIKSINMENILTSLRLGVWATGKVNSKILEHAFQTQKHVILLFSGNETRGFQGYAKMMTPLLPDLYKGLWGNLSLRLGPNFRVNWLKQCRVSFEIFKSLVNPLNDYQPIRKGRDGQVGETFYYHDPSPGGWLYVLYEIPLKEASLICTILDQAQDEDLLKLCEELCDKPRIDHSTFFQLTEEERVKKEIELGLRNPIEESMHTESIPDSPLSSQATYRDQDSNCDMQSQSQLHVHSPEGPRFPPPPPLIPLTNETKFSETKHTPQPSRFLESTNNPRKFLFSKRRERRIPDASYCFLPQNSSYALSKTSPFSSV